MATPFWKLPTFLGYVSKLKNSPSTILPTATQSQTTQQVSEPTISPAQQQIIEADQAEARRKARDRVFVNGRAISDREAVARGLLPPSVLGVSSKQQGGGSNSLTGISDQQATAYVAYLERGQATPVYHPDTQATPFMIEHGLDRDPAALQKAQDTLSQAQLEANRLNRSAPKTVFTLNGTPFEVKPQMSQSELDTLKSNMMKEADKLAALTNDPVQKQEYYMQANDAYNKIADQYADHRNLLQKLMDTASAGAKWWGRIITETQTPTVGSAEQNAKFNSVILFGESLKVGFQTTEQLAQHRQQLLSAVNQGQAILDNPSEFKPYFYNDGGIPHYVASIKDLQFAVDASKGYLPDLEKDLNRLNNAQIANQRAWDLFNGVKQESTLPFVTGKNVGSQIEDIKKANIQQQLMQDQKRTNAYILQDKYLTEYEQEMQNFRLAVSGVPGDMGTILTEIKSYEPNGDGSQADMAKQIFDSALAAKINEIQQRRILTEGNNDASNSYTWIREPAREAAFLKDWAFLEMQMGRPLTDAEIERVKEYHVNAGTELLGSGMFDPLNYIPGVNEVLEAVVKPVTALGKTLLVGGKDIELFGKTFKFSDNLVKAIPGLNKIPGLLDIVGIIVKNPETQKFEYRSLYEYLARPAITTVANRSRSFVIDTLAKVFTGVGVADATKNAEVVGKLAAAANKGLAVRDDITKVSAIFDELQKSEAAFHNMTLNDFVQFIDKADATHGGIDYTAWSRLYNESAMRTQTQFELNGRRLALKTLPADATEKEIAEYAAKYAERELAHSDSARAVLGGFGDNFSASVIDPHRIVPGSSYTDDTISGQVIKKLREIAGDAVNNGTPSAIVGGKKNLIQQAATAAYKAIGISMDISKIVFNVWTTAVLALNPRWVIQNLVDSTSRDLIYGGNIFDDIFTLTFSLQKHLADELGNTPIAIGESLSREGLSFLDSVYGRFIYQEWKPTSPLSYVMYEANRLKSIEASGKLIEDAAMLSSTRRAALSLGERLPDGQLKTAWTTINSWGKELGYIFRAMPGAMGDINSSIEFTLRLRMFHREYFNALRALEPTFIEATKISELPADLQIIARQLWHESGGNGAQLYNTAKSIVTVGDKSIGKWSVLIPPSFERDLADLHPADAENIMFSVRNQLEQRITDIRRGGVEPTEADFKAFFTEYRTKLTDDIQLYMSQQHTEKELSGVIDASAKVSAADMPDTNGPVLDFERRQKLFNESVRKLEASRKYSQNPLEVVDHFKAAVSDFADVRRVPGTDNISVKASETGVVISVGDNLLSGKNATEIYPKLQDALIDAFAHYDNEFVDANFASKLDYSMAVKKIMTDPQDLLMNDEKAFFAIEEQLRTNRGYDELLRRLGGNSDYEGVMGIVKRYIDRKFSKWSDTAYGKEVLAEQEAVDLIHKKSVDLTNAAIEDRRAMFHLTNLTQNTNISVESKARISDWTRNWVSARDRFQQYLVMNFPGAKNIRVTDPARSAAWRLYDQLRTEEYNRAAQAINEVVDAFQVSEELGHSVLDKYNDFNLKYLEVQGIVPNYDIDGTIKSFTWETPSFGTGKRTLTGLEPTGNAQGLIARFFDPEYDAMLRDLPQSFNLVANNYDDMFDQSVTMVRSLFSASEDKAKAVTKVIFDHAENWANQTGRPIEEYLASIGFNRSSGKIILDKESFINLGRGAVNAAPDGSFTFFATGQTRFGDFINEVGSLFLRDLQDMREFSPQAMEDYRNVVKILEKSTGKSAVDGKFATEHFQKFGQMFTDYFRTGKSPNFNLGKSFNDFKDWLKPIYSSLKEDEKIVPEIRAALDHMFVESKLELPAVNARRIQLTAKDLGYQNVKPEYLLQLVNDNLTHGTFAGQFGTDVTNQLTKTLQDAGFSSEESRALISLLNSRARSWADEPINVGKSVDEWFKTRIGADVTQLLGENNAVINAMTEPRLTGTLKQLGYVMRKDLAGSDLRLIEKWAGLKPGEFESLRLSANAADISRYQKAEDKFAFAFEKYLRTGQAPIKDLNDVFRSMREWLKGIYKTLKGSPLDVRFGDDVRGVFDRLLTYKAPTAPRYAKLGDVPPDLAENILRTTSQLKPEVTVSSITQELDAAWKSFQLDARFNGFSQDFYGLSLYDAKNYLKNRMYSEAGVDSQAIYRRLLNNLEQFENAILNHKYGNILEEFKNPTITPAHMDNGVWQFIVHGDTARSTYDSALNLLTHWEDYLVDAARNGGTTIRPYTQDEIKGLMDWAKNAANQKTQLVDTIVNGGKINGKNFGGAMGKVNAIMLDYTDRRNLDSIMRNSMPFWMFPSRSWPFWMKTIATHPIIVSSYNKIQKYSESMAFQRGAVTSKGQQLPSLAGYIPIPGTDLWTNPMAALSVKYLLDATTQDPQNYQENDGLEPTTSLARNFLNTSSLYGFNVSPWVTFLLKEAFHIPDNVLPAYPIIPQISLIPKWMELDLINMANKVDAKWGNVVAKTVNTIHPEAIGHDYIVERQITMDAYEQILSSNLSEDQKMKIAMDAQKAIAEHGTNPIWLAAYEKITQDEAQRSWLGFFTGIYAKPFSASQSDLLSLRNQNLRMQSAMNDELQAVVFNINTNPTLATQQYREFQGSAEGALARLYSELGWVVDSSGNAIVDPVERNKALARQFESDNNASAYYKGLDRLQKQLQYQLSLYPIGTPYNVLEPLYTKYREERANLDLIYPFNYDRSWGTNRPLETIRAELRDGFMYFLLETKPTWDITNGESYDHYQMREDEWKNNLPSLANTMFRRYVDQKNTTDILTSLHTNQADVLDGLSTELLGMANAQGLDQWQMSKDNIIDAMNRVYKITYFDPQFRIILDNPGLTYEQQLQRGLFNTAQPTPPTLEQMYEGVRALYGDRFSYADVASVYGYNGALTYDERQAQTYGNNYRAQQDIWKMLSWAGPGKKQNAFQAAFVNLTTGENPYGFTPDDINSWYRQDSSWQNDPDRTQAFRDLIQKSMMNAGIKPPLLTDMYEFAKAEDANNNFKSVVASEMQKKFGRPITYEYVTGMYNKYYGFNTTKEKRAWQTLNPVSWKMLSYYTTLKQAYGQANPLWKKYYVQDAKIQTGTITSGADEALNNPDYMSMQFKWPNGFVNVLGSTDTTRKIATQEIKDAMENHTKLSIDTIKYLSYVQSKHPEWADFIDTIFKTQSNSDLNFSH